MSSNHAFLTAEWRYLALLNYEVDPALLQAFVPSGTELDFDMGRTFISLVGFFFAKTRVLGIPVPGHRTFEEVNVRFYVRRMIDGDVRHGVVFIRELVPRALVAGTARLTFNEPYQTYPMRHRFDRLDATGVPQSVSYDWRIGDEWSGVSMTREAEEYAPASDSHERFLAERYWGYTRQRDGSTIEYRVRHPRWRLWPAASATVQGNLERPYGAALADVLRRPPTSAFFADGSAISVSRPARLSGSDSMKRS